MTLSEDRSRFKMDPRKSKPFLPPYQCNRCLKLFSTFEQCRTHKRRHAKTRVYTGFNRRFGFANTIDKKEATYEDENQVYKCDQCDIKFLSKFGLVGHQACHAVSPMLGSPRYIVKIFRQVQPDITPTSSELLFPCRYCPKTFGKLFIKEAHERDHFRQSFSKSYKCRYCYQSFTSRDVCSVHQSTHLGGSLFQCKVCTFTSVSQKKLLSHKRKHHSKMFIKCIRCDLEFKSKKKFIKHVKKLHQVNKSHKRKLFVEESVENENCKLFVEESVKRKTYKLFAEETVDKEKHKLSVEKSVEKEKVLDSHGSKDGDFALEDERQDMLHVEQADSLIEEMLPQKVTFPNVQWKSLDGETLYGCVLCGKTFTKETDLNAHKKMHVKQDGDDSSSYMSFEVNMYNDGDKKCEDDKFVSMDSLESRSNRNKQKESPEKLSPAKISNDVKCNVEKSLSKGFLENDLYVSVGPKVACTKCKGSKVHSSDVVDSLNLSEIIHDNRKKGNVLNGSDEKMVIESNSDACTEASCQKTSMKRKRSEDRDSELADYVDEKILDFENENMLHGCDLCEKSFSDQSKLILHKKSTHLKQPKLSKFFKRTSPRNTSKKTSPKSCVKASAIFDSKAVSDSANKSLGNGFDTNSASGDKEIAQGIKCSVKYVKDSSCSVQKSTDLKTNPSLKCFLCENSFSSKETLDSHTETHMSWNDISEALEHNQSSTCHLCGKAYVSSATLALHLRTHIKRPKSNRIKENIRRKYSEGNYGSGIAIKDASTPNQLQEINALGKKNNRLLSNKTLNEKTKPKEVNKSRKSPREIAKASLSDITNSNRKINVDSDKVRLDPGSCSFKPSRKMAQVRLTDIANISNDYREDLDHSVRLTDIANIGIDYSEDLDHSMRLTDIANISNDDSEDLDHSVRLTDISNISNDDSEDLNHSVMDEIRLRCDQCDAIFYSQVTLDCHTRIHKEREVKNGDHQKAELSRNSTKEVHQHTKNNIHTRILKEREGKNSAHQKTELLRNSTKVSHLDTNKDDNSLDPENTCGHVESLKCGNKEQSPAKRYHGSCNDKNKNVQKSHSFSPAKVSSPVQCNKCNLSFRSSAALEDHMIPTKHDSGQTRCKSYQCKSCDMCFIWKSHLEKHTCFQIPKYKAPVNKEKTKIAQPATKHACEQCGKKYNRKGDLTRHVMTHTGVKPFACQHCDLRFTRKSFLKRHENIHSWKNTYKCQYCDEKFPNVDRRAYHEKKHKLITNKFLCTKCGQSFPFLGSLTYHEEKVHASVKKYKCQFCQKDFAQNGDLKRHERMHTGDRPYQCSHSGCKKAFAAKILLNRHEMRKHSVEEREEPFQCNYCEKRYFEKRNLEHHLKQNHTKSKFKLMVKMGDKNEDASPESSSSNSESGSSNSESGTSDSDLPSSDLESVSSESDSSESSPC